MTLEWLSLSDVAEILGIHPSTVRVWSDKGVLPVHRTQGGHRRYLRNELDLWVQSQRAGGTNEAHLVVHNALKNTRFQISEGHLAAEAWYAKLDDEAREHAPVGRASGPPMPCAGTRGRDCGGETPGGRSGSARRCRRRARVRAACRSAHASGA